MEEAYTVYRGMATRGQAESLAGLAGVEVNSLTRRVSLLKRDKTEFTDPLLVQAQAVRGGETVGANWHDAASGGGVLQIKPEDPFRPRGVEKRRMLGIERDDAGELCERQAIV
jgi:hypothetical protein